MGAASSRRSSGGLSADEANAMFARLASGGVARDGPDDTSPSTSSSSPVDRGVDACASPTDEVNPTNMMPTPDQRKSGSQRNNLSTHRVASTIPISERNRSMPQHQKDAAATGTWQYPSEQMFFNAIKRKGWTPKEEDMTNVIAIHNAVNERCWAEVLRWESLHVKECDCPKLLKFRGRPRDYSPKARFLNFLGFKLPFDRHDWVVDRCGTDVRYVIDFYNAKSADPRSPIAMHLDTRPALDSVSSVMDRLYVQGAWMLSGEWLDTGKGGGAARS